MRTILVFLICPILAFAAFVVAPQAGAETSNIVPWDRSATYNVRDYGATGNGKSLDTDAVNKAIDAASANGGGTVLFPAGTYLCFSIRLKSNITIELGNGSTILAADPKADKGSYDLPEANEFDPYQDFGHTHWKNSLFWGIGVENVAIVGFGKIDGRGLTRRSPGPRRPRTAGETPASMGGGSKTAIAPLGENADVKEMDGLGNKAISFKLSRNITLRDITIFQGGHFALLATGVDNLTIDNLRVDTNRDGFDIDSCRNVRISNSFVNSPNDDAIVLKSSYALGFARATENVTITNSQVSAFDLGTFLDGTFGTKQEFAPDMDRPTGRLKFGTESNGGFKNIAISNINFVHCRGLAIETVDGGNIEDVSITNITMRDILTAPIFIRLGKRQRGPEGAALAKVRRINIDNVVVSGAESKYASIIAGLTESPVEDVHLSNIRIHYNGGGTKADAARLIPENEKNYPEPSMFGVLPAYGFYVRHAKGITFDNVKITYEKAEERPAFVLDDVDGIDLFRIDPQPTSSFFVLKNVANFNIQQSRNIKDQRIEQTEIQQF